MSSIELTVARAVLDDATEGSKTVPRSLKYWQSDRGNVVEAHAVLTHLLELLFHEAAEEAAHRMRLPARLAMMSSMVAPDCRLSSESPCPACFAMAPRAPSSWLEIPSELRGAALRVPSCAAGHSGRCLSGFGPFRLVGSKGGATDGSLKHDCLHRGAPGPTPVLPPPRARRKSQESATAEASPCPRHNHARSVQRRIQRKDETPNTYAGFKTTDLLTSSRAGGGRECSGMDWLTLISGIMIGAGLVWSIENNKRMEQTFGSYPTQMNTGDKVVLAGIGPLVLTALI